MGSSAAQQDAAQQDAVAAGPGPADQPIRVLELFAGIGGMRLALSYAGLPVECVAVEVNEQALKVYSHNFGEADVVRRDLTGLSAKWFERQRCRVWTMSPPCQPYTRQGKVLDLEDQRAKPLLHIIKVLGEVQTPPDVLILENVQNFERSQSCAALCEVLARRGFQWRSFLLSPRQFGFPNARQRFYLVAKRGDSPFPMPPPSEDNAGIDACNMWSFLPCPAAADAGAAQEVPAEPAPGAAQAEDAFEVCGVCGREAPSEVRTGRGGACTFDLSPVEAFLDGDSGCGSPAQANPWVVPETTLQKESARCFDVVRGGCRHSLCFTKAYGRFIDGTGSVYGMRQRCAGSAAPPAAPYGESSGAPEGVKEYAMREFLGKLRYFSPREVARLLGFKLSPAPDVPGARASCPDGACLPVCRGHRCQASVGAAAPPCLCPPYAFPEASGEDAAGRHARGLWALLGNSLNPQVVGLVCRACDVSGALRAP